MKKYLVVAVALLAALSPLSAEDYNTILFKAREQSRTLETAKLSHMSDVLRSQDTDEDGVGVSVSAQVTPIASSDPAHDAFNISRLETTVTLPNDGRTSITVGSPMKIGYDGSFVMQPSVSASHTFAWGGRDESYTDDLQETINSLQSDRSWHEAQLSYDRSVISSMSQILRTEKNIMNLEHQLENQERSLRESVELGRVTEGSVQWKRTDNSIKKTRRSLDSARDQYETQKRKFGNLTGQEWTGVENIPSYSLEVRVLPSGNTQVRIAEMQKDMAEHELFLHDSEVPRESVSLSGSLGGTIVTSPDAVTLGSMGIGAPKSGMNGSVGVTYTAPDWNVNGSFSISGTSPSDVRPVLTIGGTWKTGPSAKSSSFGADPFAAKSDRDSLAIKAEQKTNQYTDQVIAYGEKAHDLEERIDDWNWRVSEQESDLEFLREELSFEEELLEAGLSTERAVEEARFQLSLAELDDDILRLEGLTIAYDLASFAL